EAGRVAAVDRNLDPRRASAAGLDHVLDLLRADCAAHDLAGHLADEVVVRIRLAADDREAEAPARVHRDHARVATDGIAGEHDAGALRVDHLLNGDAHRGVGDAEVRTVCVRSLRVETCPAFENGLAQLVDAANPEIRLRRAGVRGLLAVLAERARADGDRRLAQLGVAGGELLA